MTTSAQPGLPPADGDGASMYDTRECIGKGAFGDVFLVSHKVTKTKYVLKKIKMARQNDWQRAATRQEIALVSRLQHPFIVPFIEHWMHHGHTINIVYGYCEKGDLGTAIQKQKGHHFDEEQLKLWLCELVLGLEYMHSQNILHRDIKTQNIFMLASGDVQIGDFGLATYRDQDSEQHDQACVGTPQYMSPELLSQKGYSYETDLWSLGCVMYELTALKHPFNAFNLAGLVSKIRNNSAPPLPSSYSQDWQNLIKSLLRKDPAKRPRYQELLALPFLYDALHRAREAAVAICPDFKLPPLPAPPPQAAVQPITPGASAVQTPLPATLAANNNYTPNPDMQQGDLSEEDVSPMPKFPVLGSPSDSGTPNTPILVANHHQQADRGTPTLFGARPLKGPAVADSGEPGLHDGSAKPTDAAGVATTNGTSAAGKPAAKPATRTTSRSRTTAVSYSATTAAAKARAATAMVGASNKAIKPSRSATPSPPALSPQASTLETSAIAQPAATPPKRAATVATAPNKALRTGIDGAKPARSPSPYTQPAAAHHESVQTGTLQPPTHASNPTAAAASAAKRAAAVAGSSNKTLKIGTTVGRVRPSPSSSPRQESPADSSKAQHEAQYGDAHVVSKPAVASRLRRTDSDNSRATGITRTPAAAAAAGKPAPTASRLAARTRAVSVPSQAPAANTPAHTEASGEDGSVPQATPREVPSSTRAATTNGRAPSVPTPASSPYKRTEQTLPVKPALVKTLSKKAVPGSPPGYMKNTAATSLRSSSARTLVKPTARAPEQEADDVPNGVAPGTAADDGHGAAALPARNHSDPGSLHDTGRPNHALDRAGPSALSAHETDKDLETAHASDSKTPSVQSSVSQAHHADFLIPHELSQQTLSTEVSGPLDSIEEARVLEAGPGQRSSRTTQDSATTDSSLSDILPNGAQRYPAAEPPAMFTNELFRDSLPRSAYNSWRASSNGSAAAPASTSPLKPAETAEGTPQPSPASSSRSFPRPMSDPGHIFSSTPLDGGLVTNPLALGSPGHHDSPESAISGANQSGFYTPQLKTIQPRSILDQLVASSRGPSSSGAESSKKSAASSPRPEAESSAGSETALGLTPVQVSVQSGDKQGAESIPLTPVYTSPDYSPPLQEDKAVTPNTASADAGAGAGTPALSIRNIRTVATTKTLTPTTSIGNVATPSTATTTSFSPTVLLHPPLNSFPSAASETLLQTPVPRKRTDSDSQSQESEATSSVTSFTTFAAALATSDYTSPMPGASRQQVNHTASSQAAPDDTSSSTSQQQVRRSTSMRAAAAGESTQPDGTGAATAAGQPRATRSRSHIVASSKTAATSAQPARRSLPHIPATDIPTKPPSDADAMASAHSDPLQPRSLGLSPQSSLGAVAAAVGSAAGGGVAAVALGNTERERLLLYERVISLAGKLYESGRWQELGSVLSSTQHITPPRNLPAATRTEQAPALELGYTVKLMNHGSTQMQGTVRYIGPTHKGPGLMMGLELAAAAGNMDGSLDGVRYFVCKPQHGLLVPLARVKQTSPS